MKRSVAVRQALYRSYADDRPTPPPDVVAHLRASFAEEVRALDALIGLPVSRRWNYSSESPGGGAST